MKRILTIAILLCTTLFAAQKASAAGSNRYDSASRDAILKEITGAKIPQTKASILKFGAKGDGKKTVGRHSPRQWLRRRKRRPTYSCSGRHILY